MDDIVIVMQMFVDEILEINIT